MRESILFEGLKKTWQDISHGYIESLGNSTSLKLVFYPKGEEGSINQKIEACKIVREEIKELLKRHGYYFSPSNGRSRKGMRLTHRRRSWQNKKEVQK